MSLRNSRKKPRRPVFGGHYQRVGAQRLSAESKPCCDSNLFSQSRVDIPGCTRKVSSQLPCFQPEFSGSSQLAYSLGATGLGFCLIQAVFLLVEVSRGGLYFNVVCAPAAFCQYCLSNSLDIQLRRWNGEHYASPSRVVPIDRSALRKW